jgi:hypothetical protein
LERGLLFGDTDLLTTAPELLARALALCYPEFDLSSQRVDVVFESVEERGRIEQALLFGWATADVLAPTATDHRRPLLCAMFNLGIGMIDSLCDNDPLRGAALLEFVQSLDVEAAASGEWREGKMLASLSAGAARDPTLAFTARVIDAFFSLLNATYAPPVRKEIGRLLAKAFAAEQRSVTRSTAVRAELLEASRDTSVLPFRIMATLVGVDIGAATQLGEALWRIDDLIDLELDARSGALNSLLLDGLPDSARIESVAREAVDHLQAGLGSGDNSHFLSFVRRYAQITIEGSTLH